MKKFALIFLTILSFAHSGGAATVSCLTKIASSEKWLPLSEKQTECMISNANFESSSKVLCSADESEISAPYAKFLDYKIKIDEAFEKVQAATNPGDRYLANAELQDLKQDQSTYAYTHGIWDALNSINSLKYHCSP